VGDAAPLVSLAGKAKDQIAGRSNKNEMNRRQRKRDRHHCRACGIPVCSECWRRDDKKCRSVQKCIRRQVPTHKCMFKIGDDLRQDQLIIQMVQLMDRLLKRMRLDLRLTPYCVLATSRWNGLVEFVDDSMPLRHVKDIRAFLRAQRPSSAPSADLGIEPEVLDNFVKSCAGYAVITYVLGIGDRHLDNIMLKTNGELFHIDFGYIFGRDPKPYAPLIRLTKQMVEAMGGPQSKHYARFLTLCTQTYLALRKRASLLLNLLKLMVDAGIEGMVPSDLFKVQDRFLLDTTDEEAERMLLQLLKNSVKGLDALWADILDFGHAIAN
jgi:phosphatidylinositol 3-kinase